MSPEADAPARIVAGRNVFGERVYVASPPERTTTCGTEYVRADVAKAEAMDMARRALRMLADDVDLQSDLSPKVFAEHVEHFVERAAVGSDFVDTRAA